MDPTPQKLQEVYTYISGAIAGVKERFSFDFDFVLIVVAKRPNHPTAHAVSVGSSETDPQKVFGILQHAMTDLMRGRYRKTEVTSA